MSKISMSQLFDTRILQEFQDAFSEYTGIASVITDSEGKQVTQSSNFSRICKKLIRKSAENVSKCMEYSKQGSIKTVETDKPCIYKCYAGLYEISCPIMLEDIIIGSLVCGQIVCTDEDEENVKKHLLDMNISEKQFSEVTENLKKMTIEELQKAADYSFKIAKILSNIAYKNNILIKSNRLRLSSSYVDAGETILDFGNDVIYNTHAMTSTVMAGIKTICNEQNILLDIQTLSLIPDELLGNPKIIQFVIEGLISFMVKHCSITNMLISFSCTEEYYLYTLSMEIVAETEASCGELADFMSNCFSENSNSENTGSVRIKEAIFNKLNGIIDFGVTEENKFKARLTIPQLDVRGNNYE